MRHLALLLTAVLLAGCSGESSSTTDRDRPSSAASTDDTASHTPTDLQHPCDVVDGRVASQALGERVSATKVSNELAARTLDCSYVTARQDVDDPLLEIRSTPDPTPLDALVGLYLGVDRLQHHPADVRDADDAEVVLQPDDDLVTVFVKQGFVTHTLVLRGADLERGERVALRLAALVVAGNRPH